MQFRLWFEAAESIHFRLDGFRKQVNNLLDFIYDKDIGLLEEIGNTIILARKILDKVATPADMEDFEEYMNNLKTPYATNNYKILILRQKFLNFIDKEFYPYVVSRHKHKELDWRPNEVTPEDFYS